MIVAENTAVESASVVQVRRGVTQLSRRLRAERRGQAMSSGKVAVLGHLVRGGAMTPGQLAQAEFVQPQSLTRVLTELTESGLISRSVHPDDGRQSLIALTAVGRQALSEDMRSRDEWLQEAMSALTQTERDLLAVAAALMERMADGV
jgi:DNA-binding MarR family transcriptional regulator